MSGKPMTDRTAIVVVGMHRSGTSALARVFSLLGAALPRNLNPAGLGNETGHWEPEAAVRLNDQILDLAESSVNDVHGPSDAWLKSPEALAFVDDLAVLIADEYGEEPLLVLKDPRVALLFPLWRAALAKLNIRCVVVVIARNPVEVALSLTKRQGLTGDWQSWPMERGGLLWLRYNLAAEEHTRDVDRAFCTYSTLLDDWRAVARRLGKDLKIKWPRSIAKAGAGIDRFLSRDLRHHREADVLDGRTGVWSSWIAPIYSELLRAEAGRAPDPGVFEAVKKSFDDVHACLQQPLPQPSGELPERIALERSTAQAIIAASRNALTGEVGRYVRSLEVALEERSTEAKEATRYATSLEDTVAKLRKANETAAEYARSLERSHADAGNDALTSEVERYVQSLQAALDERSREAEEATRYASSLEDTLAGLRQANEITTEYARSLEHAQEAANRDARNGEVDRYVRSLQVTLDERSREAEEAARYTNSLEETLVRLRQEKDDVGLYVQSLEAALNQVRAQNDAAAEYARSLEQTRVVLDENAEGADQSEVGRYVRSLQAALDERSRGAEEAARYTHSLEERLAALQEANDAATAYARSLEQSRVESDGDGESSRYVRSLQLALEERSRGAEEAAQYTRSLEEALEQAQAANDATAEYARSLEQSRVEIETYARTLEARLKKTDPGS